MMKRTAAVFSLVALTSLSFPLDADDASFNAIVSRVERNLGVEQQHIPLMGLASFIVKVAKPEGVSSLRVAIFDDISCGRHGQAALFAKEVERATHSGWKPMIRITRPRSGEHTAIYTQNFRKKVRLLIATIDDDNAVLMEVKVDGATLRRWLNDEDEMIRGIRGSRGPEE